MSENPEKEPLERELGNPIIDRGRCVRFKQLSDELGIPVVDMRQYMDKEHIDPKSVRFPLDRHWNSAGHKIAATALLEAFVEHPDWLRPNTVHLRP
jgi:hypothetical protein